jgi:hypothetical protein
MLGLGAEDASKLKGLYLKKKMVSSTDLTRILLK